MSNIPNLDISYLQSAQAQKEVTTNTALQVLDAFAGVSSITVVNGTNSPTEAVCQAGLLILTGALTAAANVVIPNTLGKRTRVLNLCTGASVTVQPYGFTAVPCAYNVFEDVWPGAATGQGSGQRTAFASVAVASSAQSLTVAQQAASIIEFTGALTAATSITFSAVAGIWAINNATTGAYTLTLTTGSGTTVNVGQGMHAIVYCDGSQIVRATADV